MAEAALTSLLVGGATAGLTAMLSKSPKPPTPKPEVRMPDPQSPEVAEAKRRRVADLQARSGRESTILSDDTYSNSLLGE